MVDEPVRKAYIIREYEKLLESNTPNFLKKLNSHLKRRREHGKLLSKFGSKLEWADKFAYFRIILAYEFIDARVYRTLR